MNGQSSHNAGELMATGKFRESIMQPVKRQNEGMELNVPRQDAFGDNEVLAVDGAHSVGTLERTRQFEIGDLGDLAVFGEIEAEEFAGVDVELVGIAQEGEAVSSGEQRVGRDFNSRGRAAAAAVCPGAQTGASHGVKTAETAALLTVVSKIPGATCGRILERQTGHTRA